MRRYLSILVAAALALAINLGGPTTATATDGTFARGYPQSLWPTTADVARGTQLSSKAMQDILRELYRTAEGVYQDGCFSGGFLCSAGTGFNVQVGAGLCVYNYETGADSMTSAYRVLELAAAEDATVWAANPGADTYYIHVAYDEAIAAGIESSDPVYTINTTSSLAGAETVCSVLVGGAEPDATTYTYTDLRTVLPSFSYAPDGLVLGDDIPITFGDGSDVECDYNSSEDDFRCTGKDFFSDGVVTGTGNVYVDTPVTVPEAGFAGGQWAFGILDCTVATDCEIADTPVSLGITFPAGSMVMQCYYRVEVTFTSGTDAATINLFVGSAGSTDLVAAAAISTGTTWDDTGISIATVQDDAIGNFINPTGADDMAVAIAVEDVTAGVMTVGCEFVPLP